MIAGVDEVGRGPLAGPVVACAVILEASDPFLPDYRDSKRLSPKRRLQIYHHLKRHALAVSVAWAMPEEIDRLNIHHASLLAMARAVRRLRIQPEKVLVDGRFVPELPCPSVAIVGGDDRIPQIAAASIVAKVVRDRYMRRLHACYPNYGFDRNKGYPTPFHLAALNQWGPCPWHRTSFRPVADRMNLSGKQKGR